MRLVCLILIILATGSPATAAESFRMIAFNIERGYKSDAELATVLAIMAEIGPADIWALSEVSGNDKDTIIQSLGPAYSAVRGTRGSDYLLIAYNRDRFSLVDDGEVFLTELSGGQRKPLWVKLRSEASGAEFYVLANHFIRGSGDDPRRLGEAEDLNRWAMNNSPAIALGDFNLDFDVNYTDAERSRGQRQQSRAYAALLNDDVWVWVRPDTIQPTQCDARYDSVLDFAFVAGDAKNWPRESKIIDIGCNDTAERPDHLPVELVITVP